MRIYKILPAFWMLYIVTLSAQVSLSQDSSSIIVPFEESGITPVTDNLLVFFDDGPFFLAGLSNSNYLIGIDSNPQSHALITAGGSIVFPPDGDFLRPTVWHSNNIPSNLFTSDTHVAIDTALDGDQGRFAVVSTVAPADHSRTVMPESEFPRGDGGEYGVFQITNNTATPRTPMRNGYRPNLFDFGGLTGRDIEVAGAAFIADGTLAVLAVNKRGGAGLGEEYESRSTSVLTLSRFDGETGNPMSPPTPVSAPLPINVQASNGLAAAGQVFLARYEQGGEQLVFLDEHGGIIEGPIGISDILETDDGILIKPAYPELGLPDEGLQSEIGAIASNGQDTFYVLQKFMNSDSDGNRLGGYHLGVLRFNLEGDLLDVIKVDDGANQPAEGEISTFGKADIAIRADGHFFVCWDTGKPGTGGFESHRPIVGRFFDADGIPQTPSFIVYDGDSNKLDDPFGYVSKDPACAYTGNTVAVMANVDDLSGEIPQIRILHAPEVSIQEWLMY